jgi:Ser/Thr protein kinase RdoA (MazF antagonist)
MQREMAFCRDVDIQELINEYGLGAVTAVRKPKGGSVNENWIVNTAKMEVVVRCVAEERSLNDIRFEHSFIRELSRSGLLYRLPKPLLNREANAVSVKNDRYFWLYEYIEGSALRSSRNYVIKQIAGAMASVHRAAKHFRLPHSKITPLALQDSWLLQTLRRWQFKLSDSTDERHRYFSAHVQECISILEGLRCTQYPMLPRFPIHGDMCVANLVFSRRNLIGIIDFGHCCLDTAIRDITISLRSECGDPKERFNLDLQAARHFMDCYTEVNPLTREETDLIPAIAMAEAADLFWWKIFETTRNRGSHTPLHKIQHVFDSLRWYRDNGEAVRKALRV